MYVKKNGNKKMAYFKPNIYEGRKGLIKLLNTEVQELIRQNKHLNLVKTQTGRAGRKKYYMKNDDYEAMAIVAARRGYDVNTFYHKCVQSVYYK